MPSRAPGLRVGATRRGFIVGLGLMVGSLVAASLAAVALGDWLGVPGASVIYLLAVVAVGTVAGTWFAIATSVGAFLVTDFLFVTPRYTFSVASTEEWLHLLLFLIVAIVIGRLTALQLERAQEAERRAAEARAMFAISRELATAASALEAAPRVAARLATEAVMTRVWLAVGPSPGEERIVADTDPGSARPSGASRLVLRPAPGAGDPGWLRVHEAVSARTRHPDRGAVDLYRVPIEAAGQALGSIWATRERGSATPGRSATRLLAAASDQFGQAVRRDRLAAEATAAAVARESDALKTALLDSVSHDLRTPLAGIRAAAGNLIDPASHLGREEERELGRSIDAEAQRLNALVHNMLDLSRIEAGALNPATELYEVQDLVEQAVDRLPLRATPARVVMDVSPGLPPVRVDPTYLGQALANLLENAFRYSGGAEIRISATAPAPQPAHTSQSEPVDETAAVPMLEVVVEDGGRGVPDADLVRIFDKFYRGSRDTVRGGRTGMGVGLAVVKGLVESMGGRVYARRSALGGLAVVMELPAGSAPDGEHGDESDGALDAAEPTHAVAEGTAASANGIGARG